MSDAPTQACNDCACLRCRGETIVRRGSVSERTPLLESHLSDAEPVLRLFCGHQPSVEAAAEAGVVLRRDFVVENVDGVDQVCDSVDLAPLHDFPGAVSLSEVPRIPRPAWCRVRG